jgi:hypothetical protein
MPTTIDKLSLGSAIAANKSLTTNAAAPSAPNAQAHAQHLLASMSFTPSTPAGLYASAQKQDETSRPPPYRYETLPRSLGRFGSDLRANPAPAASDAPDGRADKNGMAYRITAPGVNGKGMPVIFINGINTGPTRASQEAAGISKFTGRPVDLIYNASDLGIALGNTVDHVQGKAGRQFDRSQPHNISHESRYGRDFEKTFAIGRALFSAIPDKSTAAWAKNNALNNPPAAVTAAAKIYDQLVQTDKSGATVRLVGFSQGANILQIALRKVRDELANDPRYKNRVAAMMARVQVMTLGGAANFDDFKRSGVKNVTAAAHKNDIVAQIFGVNPDRLLKGDSNPFVAMQDAATAAGMAQHLNYLSTLEPGQNGPTKGNPDVARLIRDWMGGRDRGAINNVLQDYYPVQNRSDGSA